nr:group II intron maturase-specific domain-containing protein [Paraburkholderia sp. BL8N3]
MRRWRLNRQTHVKLAELAMLYNPVIQGWWNYYGAFYQTVMLRFFQHIDRALERWAGRKYKTLHGRHRRSAEWVRKMQVANPSLFHHWRVAGSKVG